MFEKRRFKKMLEYAFNYDAANPATHNGKDLSQVTMGDLMTSECEFEPCVDNCTLGSPGLIPASLTVGAVLDQWRLHVKPLRVSSSPPGGCRLARRGHADVRGARDHALHQ
jgi:hypothetical protein